MTMTVESAVRTFSAILIIGSVVATLIVDPAFLWVTVALGVMMVLRALTGYCVFARFFAMLGLRSDHELHGSGRVTTK